MEDNFTALPRIMTPRVRQTQHFRNASESTTSARRDEKEMAKFGKRQELRREFGFMSVIGFSSTLMITWTGIPIVFTAGLVDGGPAGLVYSYLFCWAGYLVTMASLVELASMIPLAGGQYHWTYLLAPKSCRNFLSFIIGWQSVLSWQASLASGSWLTGTMIQGLLVLNRPDYKFQSWHGTLLLYGVILLALLFNTYLARYLPVIEGLVLVIYVVGFFGILITLAYLAPHTSSSEVFASYLTLGGYDNITTFFVGLMTSVFAFVGADGIVHLSEEVKNASTVVPQALLTSINLNGIMGFAMLVAILFSLGDIDSALASPTGFPFIEIFQRATNSISGTTVMVSIVLLNSTFCTIAVLAVASRMTWAFARDNGLPGSQYLAKVEPRSKLPLYSVFLTTIVSMVLAVVNVPSTTAFHAVVSLTVSGYLGSYFLPIVLILHKKIYYPSSVQYGPWKLGKYGLFCNIFALIWICIVFVFSFFPTVRVDLTPDNMNWSCVIWLACMLSGVIIYFGRLQGRYNGPVVDLDVVHNHTTYND